MENINIMAKEELPLNVNQFYILKHKVYIKCTLKEMIKCFNRAHMRHSREQMMWGLTFGVEEEKVYIVLRKHRKQVITEIETYCFVVYGSTLNVLLKIVTHMQNKCKWTASQLLNAKTTRSEYYDTIT